jgi:periplasmic protein TonB
MEILKYVKYCLSLFEECTINGLGTFQFVEAPPEKDANNNFIKKKYHVITFVPHSISKPRLINIIAGKESCSVEQATAAINRFSENIQLQLGQNKEVWISEIGLLKKENNQVILLSHKFPVKAFKAKSSQPTNTKQAAPLPFAGTTGTALPELDELVESSRTEFSIPTAKEVAPPVQKKNTSTDNTKEAAITPEKESSAPVKTISHRQSTPVAHTDDLAKPIAAINATPVSPVFTGGGFANEDKRNVQQDAALSIPESRFKIASLELYNKAFNFSKKYIVHIGIALGLLIATIITIRFYVSESSSSINANTSSIIPTITSGNTVEPTSEENNIQFGESTPSTKNKQSNNKENKESLLTTTKEDQKNNSEKNNSTTDTAPLTPINNNPVATTNVETDANTVSSDHIPATTTAGKEIVEQPKTAPAATTAQPEKNETASPTVQQNVTEPEFPGGEKAIEKYIRNKVQYPEKALEEGISGSVKVSFTVDENGNVKNPIIVDGLGGGCNEEAIRVINKMPKWTPAMRDGAKVGSRKTIKITFRQGTTEKRPTPIP